MKKILNILVAFSFVLFLASCGGETKEQASNKGETTSENASGTESEKKVKMILDLDTGIDDAMALAYALGSPEIELIGVVGTFGNVNTKEGVQNVLNLLHMFNRKDVPVYIGATHSFSSDKEYFAVEVSKFIHGSNGIGGVKIEKSDRQAETTDGIDFIIESVQKYRKDLTIVATGPVTNLTLAIRKEPKLKDMVGNIVIMGGALLVEGNINHYAEANIYQDPLAANEFFISGTPFTMVGLEVTQRPNLTKADTQKWRDLETVSGKAFADIVDYYIDAYAKNAPQLGGCALHDPLAVAVSIHPEFVKTLKLPMKVGTSKDDWGRTVADNGKMNEPNHSAQVCVDLEVQEFVTHFTKILTDLFAKN